MPTWSPLLVLGPNVPPLPKFVGPVNPVYRSDEPDTMIISPVDGRIPATPFSVEEKVSPVKLMAPLPVATTLDPICCSVTVKAWAGPTLTSDVKAIPKSISSRSFLGKAFMTSHLATEICTSRQPTRANRSRAEKLLCRHRAPQPLR